MAAPDTPRDVRRLRVGKQQLDVRWTRLDRAIEAVAPAWAGKRLQSRVGHALTASIGGWNGADRTRRSLSGWNPLAGDADSDTLGDLPALRTRSEDLYRNSPVAGGAIDTTCTHVIGTGLSLQASIDGDYLGLDADECDEWQQDVERKFNAWFESTDCDITRTQDGYGLQDLALRSELVRGDCLAILTKAPFARGPVQLAVQLIEADRLCNPDRKPDTATLVAGVQLDGNGAPVAYSIASANPYRRAVGTGVTWQSVPAFGAKTGRRNVLHLFTRNRIGLTRGVPVLAPVIEPLKQLERYTEAELMAAVVSGLFTVFIQAEGQAQLAPSALAAGSTGGSADSWNGQLGNGLVVQLGQGESVNSANPGRPNSQFDPFVSAIIKQVGLRLGIPYEVLVKNYTSSYTAAQAALLDAWRTFRTRRDRHAGQFCNPIYGAWMDEAVASGYVAAPGYFADPLARRAWLGCQWVGDGPGAIRPDIAVESAEKRIALGISTKEAESVLHDGVKWRKKLAQRAREEQLTREAMGEPDPLAAPAPGVPAAPMPPRRPDPTKPDDQAEEE